MIATRNKHIPTPQNVEPQLLDALAASSEARALRRRVWGLAAPVIGENFLETLLGIVETLLVAGLGAVAIAGVGSALQIMFFLISALSALAIGSSVLVAQAVGGGDTADIKRRILRMTRGEFRLNRLHHFHFPAVVRGDGFGQQRQLGSAIAKRYIRNSNDSHCGVSVSARTSTSRAAL